MRYAATILVAVTLLGCADENAGQFPLAPPEKPTAFLVGMVVDGSGVCIPGAAVRVVLGQRVGETITQTTPCDVWASEGGFVFNELIPRVEMTVQATAPGYATEEKRFSPFSGPQVAVLFTLSRDK